MKRFALMLIVLLWSGSAFAAYTPSDITYDAVSNPTTLSAMLRDLFANYQGTSVLFDPQTTAPTVSEGKLYYNDTSNALYLYTGSGWELVDTEGGTSLDAAYNLGSAITVDGSAITLTTGAAVNNSVLSLVGGETSNNNDTFTITHAGTGDAISINGASTGNLIYDEDGNFTVSSAGVMSFVGGDTTGDFGITGSAANINFDVSRDQLSFADNAVLGIGGADDAAGDFTFTFDTTNLVVESAAGDDAITFGATTNFDLIVHGATATNEITFDTDDAALECIFDGFDLRLNDDDYIIFGDGATDSFTAKFDETTDNLQVVATTANDAVQFGDATTNTDVLFIGSAGTTSTNRVHYNASGDTNLGEWNFGADDYGVDVQFFGATASQVVTWDQSADAWYFGADAEGVDVHFRGDTTLKQAWWDESGNEWFFGDTGYGIDVSLYAATAGDLILWDASDEQLEWVGSGALFDDDSDIFIGSDKDFSITSDTAKELDILAVTTDESSVINFGATTSGVDVRLWGATGAGVALFDASADAVLFEQYDIALGDGDKILLGDTLGTGDFVISSTSAVLTVAQVAADTGTIVFGASGTDVPITWNGETAGDYVQFNVDQVVVEDIKITIMDDTQLAFGDGNDVTIEYDENGTDELEITGNVRVAGNLGYKMEVTTDIDNRVLTAEESGGTFNNWGDTDGTIFTLPTAAPGLVFTFIDAEAATTEDVYILANTSDKIQGGTAAQYYNCYDDTAFSHVTLLAIDAENWVVIASGGTWTADADMTSP